MKVDTDLVDYIINVVKTAKLVNIDNVIIEPGIVRAMSEARTVILHSSDNVPDMPFESIGITRINDLITRYDMAKSIEKFAVEATAKEDGDVTWCTQLLLKAKGLKIDYRCFNPRKLNAPKHINDSWRFKVPLTEEAVTLLQKGTASMSAEFVTIISNDGVSFEFADDAKDVFKHTFADDAELIPDDDGEVASSTKFAHRYYVKLILAIFKNNPTGTFTVGQRGILSFPVNGLTVYVLPQV